jgi:hypothetical protein
MSYRDIRLLLSKASAAITVLGIKRTEVNSVTVHNLSCLVPRIELEVECFIRLCRMLNIRPSVERTDDWLKGEFRYREFSFTTHVWSKDDAYKWEALNGSSQPMLEAKRPAIGVKRPAIADKRRLIGLPAPKVIDV